MFSLAILALASIASSATALVIPRSSIPSTYGSYLEPYHGYHIRYMALDCEDKHDTSFFEDCCHPMLATQNLKDDRKPYCIPSPSASSSAAQAEPTSTDVPSGDDDCNDNESSSAADPTPTSADTPKNDAPSPAPSPSPSSSSSDKPQPQPATTSSSQTPKSSSSSSGGDNGVFSNIVGNVFGNEQSIGTFFFQNGVAGNCGTVHSDGDHVVALPTITYANGAHCGKTIQIQNTKNGKTATGVVADSCPSCGDQDSIDLSTGLYDELASEVDGDFPVRWAFIAS